MVQFQIIVNASAGGGRGAKIFEVLRQKVQNLGISADCALAQNREDALAIARRAEDQGYDFIVACGGDGTIHSFLPAVVNRSLGLGVIPLGTANDLARSWKIPFSLDPALELLCTGRPRKIDVIQLSTGEYIAGAAGVGFDVAVVERAERLRRKWKGIAPFFLAAFTEFLRYRFPDISLDGGEWKYRGPAWQAIFTKIPRYALLLRIPSSIQMDDGLMTVCFIPPVAKIKVFYLFPFFLFGGMRNLEAIRYFSASEVKIESSPVLRIHGDGEVIGRTPATLRVIPKGLKVLMPP